MESCFNCTQWMSSHTQTNSLFISSVRTDWQSSSPKHRKLAKSFSSRALSGLRSSAEKVPSSNIWRQPEFMTAGLRDVHLGWNHFHLVRFVWMQLVRLLLRHVDVRKQFFFFIAQWRKMRWSSPWQQLEIQSNEQFKLSA